MVSERPSDKSWDEKMTTEWLFSDQKVTPERSKIETFSLVDTETPERFNHTKNTPERLKYHINSTIIKQNQNYYTKWKPNKDNSTSNVHDSLFRLYNIDHNCHITNFKVSKLLSTINNDEIKDIIDTIVYCNIQGNVNQSIKRKMDSTSPLVRDIIIRKDASIIALAEFQDKPKYIKYPQDCTLLAYIEPIKDQYNKKGPGAGGMAIYAKTGKVSLYSNMKTISENNKCYICIKIESIRTVVIFVYVKPAMNTCAHFTTIQLYNDLIIECTQLFNSNYNILCLGDFNAKIGSIVGDNDIYAFKNQNDNLFYQFATKFDFLICNSIWQHGIPTRFGKRNNTIIDYALVRLNNNMIQLNTFKVHNILDYWSDHKPISLSFIYNNINTIDNISHPAKYRTILMNKNDETIAAAMIELDTILSAAQRNSNKRNSNKKPTNKLQISLFYNKWLIKLNHVLIKFKIKKFKRLNTNEELYNRESHTNIKVEKLDQIIDKLEYLFECKSNNLIDDSRYHNQANNLKNEYINITRKIEYSKSQKIIEKLESKHLYGDTKFAYQMLNSLNNKTNKNQPLLDNNGNILWKITDKINLMWRYFSNLYKLDTKIIHPTNIKFIQSKMKEVINVNSKIIQNENINNLNRPFTEYEIIYYVASEKFRKKMNKAWGLDLISNKIVFYYIFKSKQINDSNGHIIQTNLNNKNIKQITKLYNFILDTGEIPEHFDWDHLIIIPKKLEAKELKDYRGISLQVAFYKLLDSLITNRIEPIIDTNLCKEQGGFRHYRGVMEQLFTLRTIILHYRQRLKKPIFLAFMDFEKAFDTIWIERLLIKIWDIGIRGKIWRYFDKTYNNIKCVLEINDVYSSAVNVTRGLRQGGNSSPPLFNIAINDLIKLLNKYKDCGVSIGSVVLTCLMFADDLALLASSIIHLQMLILVCAKWAFWAGTKFNAKKCKILIITPNKYDLKPNNISIFLPIYKNTTNNNESNSTIINNLCHTQTSNRTTETLVHKALNQPNNSNKNVSSEQMELICDQINDWSLFICKNNNNNINNINNTYNQTNIYKTDIHNIILLTNTNLVSLIITQEGDGCKYLGIIQQNGSTYLLQRQKLVTNSKAAMCNVMNFQEIGEANNIALSINMYQSITRAIMLVGSETLNVSETFIENSLESIQHQSLCFIFGVYHCVFRPFLRLLAGLPPIIAIWHFNRIKSYFKIITNTKQIDSIASIVAAEDYKLFVIDMNRHNSKISGTMTDEIWELMARYSIHNKFNLLLNKIDQSQLTQINNNIKNVIWKHYWRADTIAIRGAATLNNFNCNLLDNINNTYQRAKLIEWTQFSNNRSGVKWLYRFWSGRAINNFYNKSNRSDCTCKHCKRNMNHLLFIKHILIDCERLKELRRKYRLIKSNSTKDILDDEECNIHNLIKFLSIVMN